MDHYETNYVKKDCFPHAHPSEESCERSLSSMPWPHSRKLMNSTYSQNEGPAIQTVCLHKSSLDFSTSLEPGSVTSSNSFMGKFFQLGIYLLQLTLKALNTGFLPNVTVIPSESRCF